MSRSLISVALLACLCQAADPYTLEQIMSSAFPSGMAASPSGGKVAWILNARGARNIWVAEPPDYRGRAVTSYTADDGQEIGNLHWTPDGRAIVYVRGGAANRQGEIPNPTSDARGVEQAIWMVAAAGGEPKRIAEGSSPAVSPDGKRIAYLNRGQIWWASLDGAEKPAQAIKARGQCSDITWSPDGTKVAFTNNRSGHGFIGVFDVASRSLLFLDPSVDRDSNAAWSPDSKRVAFLRLPARREAFMFGPVRSAQPWSIRVADAASGRGRLVWKAEEGRGSAFRNIVAVNQILWGAGDRLVFPWERHGWTHLYSVPASEGPATPLTLGDFEVEYVTLSHDRSAAVFNSNQEDIDRRHIWRVPVTGGRVEAVTTGKGIEWDPVPTSDGKALAYFSSDARRPARAVIRTAGSAEARELAPGAVPADFPSAALVEPQAVTFAASDGMQIPAQLFLPAGIRPGERRPAAIFFHGGSRRQMLLGWNYSPYYHNAYALNQYLASRGYVVLSVNYRSGIGYGMEFREALDYGATGASEYQDVVGAGLYLRNRSDVDPKRIGLWGGSYGGYLTALGLARASDLFACGVDIHGVHDWNVVIRNFIPAYDPEKRLEAARLAFESSPMASVKSWRSPVLLIHGDDDRNVPFSETVTLAEELRKHGVPFEQLVFPDEVHSFLRHANWLRAYDAAAGFFDRHLRPR